MRICKRVVGNMRAYRVRTLNNVVKSFARRGARGKSWVAPARALERRAHLHFFRLLGAVYARGFFAASRAFQGV